MPTASFGLAVDTDLDSAKAPAHLQVECYRRVRVFESFPCFILSRPTFIIQRFEDQGPCKLVHLPPPHLPRRSKYRPIIRAPSCARLSRAGSSMAMSCRLKRFAMKSRPRPAKGGLRNGWLA